MCLLFDHRLMGIQLVKWAIKWIQIGVKSNFYFNTMCVYPKQKKSENILTDMRLSNRLSQL